MGQIMGVDASLITNIAGVAASSISYIGPISAATLGLGGGGSKTPSDFPYSFTPGTNVLGANIAIASDRGSIDLTNNSITGAQRDDDLNNLIKNPTIELKNIGNKFYNLNIDGLQKYVISQWVKINNFPRKLYKGNPVRKKKTSISRYDFKDTNIPGLTSGFIEFGAIAPYYTDGVNFEGLYKGVFSPFSFGVCISNYKYPVSLYTDYSFQLETWYMLSVEITFEAGAVNQAESVKGVRLWVDDKAQPTALFLGKPWGNKIKNTGKTNRNKGNSGGARSGNIFANVPGFLDYNKNSIPSSELHNIYFNSFVNIAEMNYASFSPIKRFNLDTINNGIHQPLSYSTLSTNAAVYNSRIDFGALNIYSGDTTPSMIMRYFNPYK
jgi:hypothetical protein